MTKKLVYIVGVGRSGTSLLQSMLNAHSEIFVTPETALFRYFVTRQLLQKEYEKGSLVAVERKLQDYEPLKRVAFDFSKLSINPSKSIDKQVYQAVHLPEDGEAQTYVDKDPRLVEYLCSLSEVYPHALVIHIVRDPRDVLCSKMKASWSQGRSLFVYAFANYIQLKMAQKFGKTLFNENFLELRYEDLLERPEHELKSIVNSLDLQFEDSMLDFGSKAKSLVSEEELSWKKETLGPLLKANTEKWRSVLTKFQLAILQSTCKHYFKMYKYEPDWNDVSVFYRIVGAFTLISFWCVSPIYIGWRKRTQKSGEIR